MGTLSLMMGTLSLMMGTLSHVVTLSLLELLIAAKKTGPREGVGKGPTKVSVAF